MSTDGGAVPGSIYQAGGDIHVGQNPQEAIARYEPKWSWQSPLTLALLTWISVGLGLVGLAAGWQSLAPLFTRFDDGGLSVPPSFGWTIVLCVVLVILSLSVALRRVARNRTQHFSPVSWLPALTGWGGQVGLAKLRGSCPIDGGRLRFYDKPMYWTVDLSNGKRKVTQRRMAAECVKNKDHWWPVDKTDGGRD